jgi:hypothetical protein
MRRRPPAERADLAPAPLVWDIAFHSGMSASSDLRAAVQANASVGVVAPLLNISQLIRVLPVYLDRGGKVFIDSGAFASFQKREPVIWDKVFFAYEAVLNMTDRPGGLSIVAPDVIGDQQATLDLWREHAERVSRWVDAGARVIVPLQRGDLAAGEMLEFAKQIFQTDRFTAGIPSNLEAMSVRDCATLRHHDFHVLGRVVATDEVQAKVDVLRDNNPGATLTADANWLRSRLAKVAAVVTQPLDLRVMDTRRTQAVRQVLLDEGYGALGLEVSVFEPC